MGRNRKTRSSRGPVTGAGSASAAGSHHPQKAARGARGSLSRRAWVAIGGTVLIMTAALVLRAALAPARPSETNLLLLTLDTTRADHLGCYGASPGATPNLDLLARRGVLFSRCETCVPLTLPSHCSILTGTYPFVHGVRRNGFERLSDGNTTLAEILSGAGFACHAIVASAVLSGRFGLQQGFESYQEVPTAGARNIAMAELRADQITDEAITVLRRAAPGRFFLWVHYYDPHYPYQSRTHPDPLSPEAYADEVSFMDGEIGRLLDSLQDLGLSKKTLVVAVGDHGEGLGEHGESEHGYFLYESCMHVPLIVSCPDLLPAGKTVTAACGTVDLAPTILDLLHLPVPAIMQGKSFAQTILTGAPAPFEPLYGETESPAEVFALSPLRCLYADGRKYIHAPVPELYALSHDPGETDNLAAGRPDELAALRRRLEQLLGDAPPPPGGDRSAGSMTQQEIEQFRSLGYLAGEVTAPESTSVQTESLELTGGNPMAHAAAIELYARSHRFTAERQWARSEPLLRQVVEELPGAPNPLKDLSLALRQQGKPQQLLDFCRDLLGRQPSATTLRLFYAGELLEARDPDAAVAQLERAVALDPGSAEAHIRLAGLLRSRDQGARAEAEYKEALRLDPENAAYHRSYGLFCLKGGRSTEAVAALRQAFELNPRSVQIQRDLDKALEMQKKDVPGTAPSR